MTDLMADRVFNELFTSRSGMLHNAGMRHVDYQTALLRRHKSCNIRLDLRVPEG